MGEPLCHPQAGYFAHRCQLLAQTDASFRNHSPCASHHTRYHSSPIYPSSDHSIARPSCKHQNERCQINPVTDADTGPAAPGQSRYNRKSIYSLKITANLCFVSLFQDQFKQTLQQLSNDADPDVHYYATQALKAGQ